MTVYELPPNSPYQKPFRFFAWGAVVVLLGILAFSVDEPAGLSDAAGHSIGWFAVAVTLAAVVSAAVFAAKDGLWKSLRTLRFDLSDGRIIQTREASSSPIEIPLDQIEYLRESSNWLIVGGGSPRRQIAIPKKLRDFDSLKGELVAHCTPTPLKVRFGPLSFVPFVLMIVTWFFLFTSHSRSVVISAGVAALTLQTIGTYSLLKISRGKTPKLLVLTFVLFTLAVGWLVYQQVTIAR